MKNLIEAVALIFSNDDWFNKVLVGGFYTCCVLLLFPIVMINGFMVEYIRTVMNGSHVLPYWRNSKSIFKTGWKVSLALVLYYATATLLLHLAGCEVISVQTAILYFILHTTLHPIVLLAYAKEERFLTCFNISRLLNILSVNWKELLPALCISSIVLLATILLGWMWIVVGWPLLVFLALLIQNTMVALSLRTYFLSQS
ncbi:MAG: DUF4013 domain-containing protein [Bacteroidota bacterium]